MMDLEKMPKKQLFDEGGKLRELLVQTKEVNNKGR